MNKEKYNELFHNLVTSGICVGLIRPQEWIVNLARNVELLFKPSEYDEISEFIDLVERDFCSVSLCKDNITPEDIGMWYNSLYNSTACYACGTPVEEIFRIRDEMREKEKNNE